MEETGWEVTDISVVIDNITNNGSDGSTAALPTTLSIPTTSYYKWSKVALISGLGIPIVPLLVNMLVIVVLILAHRQHGSAANVFIVNHSATNLLIFASAIINRALRANDIGEEFSGNQLVDDIVCIIVIGPVFAQVGGAAQISALVIITLERYFKIVHAIAHRKYYKGWMTKLGVALPWIFGVCFAVIPHSVMTRYVNGRCFDYTTWPNEDMRQVNLKTYDRNQTAG